MHALRGIRGSAVSVTIASGSRAASAPLTALSEEVSAQSVDARGLTPSGSLGPCWPVTPARVRVAGLRRHVLAFRATQVAQCHWRDARAVGRASSNVDPGRRGHLIVPGMRSRSVEGPVRDHDPVRVEDHTLVLRDGLAAARRRPNDAPRHEPPRPRVPLGRQQLRVPSVRIRFLPAANSEIRSGSSGRSVGWCMTRSGPKSATASRSPRSSKTSHSTGVIAQRSAGTANPRTSTVGRRRATFDHGVHHDSVFDDVHRQAGNQRDRCGRAAERRGSRARNKHTVSRGRP
jgi:hypothetical protein